MLQDIIDYLAYLTSLGLQVSVHFGQNAPPGLPSPVNIHSNPYCLAVKSSPQAHAKCIQCQKRALQKCIEGAFFGMCYAGMEEFVFPIQNKSGVSGFVSVSGYCSREKKAEGRIKATADKYQLPETFLFSSHKKHTLPPPQNRQLIATLIHPLCHMLALWREQNAALPPASREEDDIYSHLIAYLQEDFGQEMTVKRLSQLCHCSVSYVSHLFKHRTGCSVSEYKNQLRIERAKQLLSSTSLAVGEIAESAGFSDSNYFSSLFRNTTGLSPSQYRKKYGKEHQQ